MLAAATATTADARPTHRLRTQLCTVGGGNYGCINLARRASCLRCKFWVEFVSGDEKQMVLSAAFIEKLCFSLLVGEIATLKRRNIGLQLT
jgi:hypothetical protein